MGGLKRGSAAIVGVAESDLGHVAEGVDAARAVRRLAAQYGVDMPICEAVDRTLHEGLPVREAVAELLRREPRPESN
jgi:glycerol-3-phosphate dehydrogenase (NAD(P)+)